MNVLLIQPDIERKRVSIEGIFPSVGLNLLATILNQKGHPTHVVDSFMEVLIYENSELDLLKIMEQKIIEKQIQIVGISTVLQTRFKAIGIAKFVKSINSSIKVVLGGPGASLLVSKLSKHFGECIDVVAMREGEETLPELIEAITRGAVLSKVKGIAYKNPENPKEILLSQPREPIQNLDKIPFPDYSHYLKYLPQGQLKTASVLTSRGCPFNCSYCGTRAMWGGVRYRSPSNVIEEIVCLHKNYGVENLRIHDDTFGVNKSQTVEILENIIKLRIKIKLYAHSRVDIVDKEILTLFKRAGGASIYYGMESGSPRIRELMGRNTTNDQILKACAMTKELGIKLGLFLMFGYPTETPLNVKQTYELVKAIDPDDVYCAVTKVQPGTQLYQVALGRKIVSDDIWVKEDKEYYTFLSEEDEEIIKGYEIIFYENFSKKLLRSAFEKNNDLLEAFENPKTYSLLKEKAMNVLGNATR